ncbi:extracellular solute-binding protein [Haloarchaeobius sp. DFWS5]|uniref:extracellular solute-binding protein n=1 Tax=Haloarchaeobius sp. DFWS5 TaxID=3446114 RepID=UPI003EBFB398
MQSRRALLRGVVGVAAAGAVGSFTYGQLRADSGDDTPTALVAGSLLALAAETSGASVEAHGSGTVRHLVLDGLREPDVVALADPSLFAGVTDAYTLFATNALVLAYDPDSPHAAAIRRDWRRACTDPAIRVGRTDPDLDPLGYRTVLALELDDELDAPAVLDQTRIFAETGLVNALEAGGVDAAFTYRNMAEERGLPIVDLPATLDFSDPAHADRYASVSYDLDGQTIRGAPIRYGVAALTPRGEAWAKALASADGRLVAHGFSVPTSYPRMAAP